MSESSGDQVVVVSVFGRGSWMAAELQNKGLKVVYIDLSEKMGIWPPEDLEGPFGIYHNEKIPLSYLKHLNAFSPFRALESGLTVWTKDLPLELKSPVIREQLTARQITPPENPMQTRKPFSEEWLASFCHQWGYSVYHPSTETPRRKTLSPYLKDFAVRNPTRSDSMKILELLKSSSVKVITQAEILDLSFEGRQKIQGLEIQGKEKGIVKADFLVWCLSSEETQFVSKKLFKHLFHEVKETEWSWLRFRFQFQDCLELGVLPEHFNLIADVFSPWTHANWIICQRTAISTQIDAWIRIPSLQRFNKSYLNSRSLQIKEVLDQRLVKGASEVISFPQEYYYSYEQVGPSKFPQFLEEEWQKKNQKQLVNAHFYSVENWKSALWPDRYEQELSLVSKLHEEWVKLESKKNKRKEVEL